MQRCVLVLEKMTDDDRARRLVLKIATRYGDEEQTTALWSIVDELPEWMGIAMSDQLGAHKRDAGAEACYMVIYICTREEARELYADGKWDNE